MVETGGAPFGFWKVLNIFRGYMRPCRRGQLGRSSPHRALDE